MKNIFTTILLLFTVSWAMSQVVLEVTIECTDSQDVVSAVATGGVLPYVYQWSNGATTQEITVEDNETYSVTVTDAIGFEDIAQYTHEEFSGNLFCNDNINLSVANSLGINQRIFVDMLIQGPYAECTTDLVFNISDLQGTEILSYAPLQIITCSLIGTFNYHLVDNITGADCTGMLTIEDKTGPIPICVGESTALLNADQEVELWASDFDAGSFDFCDPDELRFTFSSVAPDQDPNYDPVLRSSRRVFGCADFFGSTDLDIYFWDKNDNFDFCKVTLNLDDSQNPCLLEGNHLEVEDGLCNTPPLDRYNISLNGTEVDNIGCFYPLEEDNIVTGTNVIRISNVDNSTSLNGISTIDLVQIIQGLLFGFPSGIQAVLADFDGDLAVSTQDLIKMRRIILGNEAGIDAPYYKIFPADLTFGSDFDPFDQQTDYQTYEFEDTEIELEHIVNIYKSGDLNNSANFNAEIISSNREVGQISFDNINMIAGQTYSIDFEMSADESFQGAAFKFLANGIEIKSIESHGFDIMDNIEEGNIAISFLEFDTREAVQFTLEVEALQNINAENAFTLSDEFLNEIVFADLSMTSISLSANDLTGSKDTQFETLAIYPNPSNDFVNISFGDTHRGELKQIEIVSLDGKIISRMTSFNDQIEIDVRALQSSGLHLVKARVGDKNLISKFLIK